MTSANRNGQNSAGTFKGRDNNDSQNGQGPYNGVATQDVAGDQSGDATQTTANELIGLTGQHNATNSRSILTGTQANIARRRSPFNPTLAGPVEPVTPEGIMELFFVLYIILN